jgi:hypothetical protein
MIHGERGSIPENKSETTDVGKKHLSAFIKEIEKNRIRKSWTNPDALKLAVREALDHAKATKPAIGWVRGDVVSSVEALEELNKVRKENAKFRDAIGHLEIEIALPPIPSVDEDLHIDLLSHSDNKGYRERIGSNATIATTWIAVFPIFFNNLKWETSDYNSEYSYYIDEEKSCVSIGSAIAGETAAVDASHCFKISKSTLDRLSSYYIEAGLINPIGLDRAFTDLGSGLIPYNQNRTMTAMTIAEKKISAHRS